jgi:hypothetical protein
VETPAADDRDPLPSEDPAAAADPEEPLLEERIGDPADQ